VTPREPGRPDARSTTTGPERQQQLRAWGLTWFAYASYYLGRKGFSVSKKTLYSEHGISEATLGAIDTAYLMSYALGQFASGLIGDRLGARRLIGYGLIGSAATCALFGSSRAALAFGIWFCLNGLFQSTGWPGTTRAMAEWTTPENRGTVMAFWSTCYQVGGVAANALAGYLLVTAGFRASFLVPALLLLAMGLLILRFLPSRSPVVSASDALLISNSKARGVVAIILEAQRAVLENGLLWSYGASYFFIKFIRYALLFWLPYYLSTVLVYRADVSANVSSAFEIGGVLGVIFLGVLSDRLRSVSRALVSCVSLLALAGALFAYTWMAAQGILYNVVGLALIGVFLFGPDALLSGAAAQDAGGRYAAATATGMVNGLGSLGAIVEGLLVPQISARWGWPALFPILVGLALGAALCLVPAILKGGRG
jgi:sugar phosphate permease